jgi:hypothetical protein
MTGFSEKKSRDEFYSKKRTDMKKDIYTGISMMDANMASAREFIPRSKPTYRSPLNNGSSSQETFARDKTFLPIDAFRVYIVNGSITVNSPTSVTLTVTFSNQISQKASAGTPVSFYTNKYHNINKKLPDSLRQSTGSINNNLMAGLTPEAVCNHLPSKATSVGASVSTKDAALVSPVYALKSIFELENHTIMYHINGSVIPEFDPPYYTTCSGNTALKFSYKESELYMQKDCID